MKRDTSNVPSPHDGIEIAMTSLGLHSGVGVVVAGIPMVQYYSTI